MIKITAAAKDFSERTCSTENKAAREFFRKLKKDIKRAESAFRSEKDHHSFLIGAKSSARALETEAIFPVFDGKPYMFWLSQAYLSVEDGSVGASLAKFLEIASEKHDFLISEMTFFRDFLVVALFYEYLSCDGDKKQAIVVKYDLLEYVPFPELYFKYTKVHAIFSSERAGIYDDCSRDTQYHYDDMLIEKYGSNEIENAKMLVEKADAEGEHVGKYLKHERGSTENAYFWLLSVLTVCAFFVVLLLADVWAALLAILPCYALAKEIALMFFERSNYFLPALSSGDEMKKTKCIVAVTTLLRGEASDREIFDNIEDFYLSNKQGNYVFTVLGDLKEADRKSVSGDAAVIRYAESRIRALREKYGDRFALFVRRRRYAVCEKKYFGWERKRGAVIELCRYASGGDGSFETVIGGEEARGAKYLLTLDSDTRLGISSVSDLLGIMIHPQNRPKIDKKAGVVTSGFGIVQPKTATSLESSSKTLFASLTSGDGGVDRYSSSSFDLYQDVFGRGVFCGKGMIDIDAFLSVCDGFFPKERILSHDLLEGALARAATAKRVVLTDSTPKNSSSYFSRLDRWLRGDLQALGYVSKRIRNEKGEKIENPMGLLSRFQILDNIFRAATPLFSIALLAYGFFFGKFYALLPIAFVLVPFIKTLISVLFSAGRYNLFSIEKAIAREAAALFFRVSSAATHAGVFIKATVNVIYSSLFTKRGFLSWTTAAEAEAKGGFGHFAINHLFSIVSGAAFMFLPFPAVIIGIAWAIFPFLMLALGKERTKQPSVSSKNKAILRGYSEDIWRFFSENVNENTNWLPPDNIQLSPVRTVAMRTSPTNIGLYFLSLLAARDFKFIGTDELFLRASSAVASLKKMEKWNGHLYNWYDLRSLSVTGSPFVSSVDSGNFVTSLVAFCEGIKEYAAENVKLIDARNALVNFIYGADFGKLINKERGFLSVGYNASTGALSNSCYDMLMSESRTTSYFSEAMGYVPSGYYFSLGRRIISRMARIGAASWSGTAFEFFMPSLLLPEPKNSFSERALDLSFSVQSKSGFPVPEKVGSVFGVSESCFFEFDGEMNYQYRAFGLDALSLDPKTNAERVVAPYASFLMIKKNVPRVMANLEKLKSAGMYGRYGFYEALDLEKKRVGNGYAVIKCFMSHHLGMSIVAAANACFGDVFVKRFMRDANMRACRGLLGERTPTAMCTSRKKEKQTVARARPPIYRAKKEIIKRPPTLLKPNVAMLSNNKTRIIASSAGQIAFYDGADLVVSSPFERLSLGGGMQFCALADGVTLSVVPLGYTSDGVRSKFDFEYDFEKVIYRSFHEKDGKKIKFDVVIKLYENEETAEISYKLSGDVESARMLIYFEPVIDDAAAFGAHKSFSNLFIESKYYPDERALVFARRPRSDGKPFKYLGVFSDPPMAPTDFDTRRENALPLMYENRDISALMCSSGEGKTGADIVPMCAIRTDGVGGKTRRATFRISYSQNCDDLLYMISSSKRELRGGIIRELQRAASGADETVYALESELLSKIVFSPTPKKYSSEALLRALSKKPIYRNGLWRHGISGDMNIVCAVLTDCNDLQLTRLNLLLRLFKYCCIRGLRFDLVILYSETDAYSEPIKNSIHDQIKSAGLSSFIGCDGGIFALDGDKCSDGERFVLTECSAKCFDLSAKGDIFAADGGFELSDEMTKRLKCAPRTEILDIPLPARFENAEKVLGGYATENGFVVEKCGAAPPKAHVISSRCFGTVLTENSLGFTFFSNSAFGKLTPHASDNMNEDRGERIIIRVYVGAGHTEYTDYDAAACAKFAYYSDGRAEYFGKVEDVFYKMNVSLCGKFPAKSVKITLYCDGKTRVKIIYLFRACLGAVPKERAVASFFDAEQRCASFSPIFVSGERAVRGSLILKDGNFGYFDDEAAMISDKAVFGGGAVVAIYDEETFSKRHECEFFLCHCESEETKRYVLTRIIGDTSDVAALDVTPRILTGNKLLDSTVNFWFPYQTIASRICARAGFYQVGGAYGFRDQLQDVISLIPYDCRMTREHLIRAASHQYEDGSVMHWWHAFGHPHAGIRSRCSDDSAWLAFVLSEYVTKTGDTSILDVKTPYLSSPPLEEREYERYERAPRSPHGDSVLIHALRGLERTFRTGAHGLPLIGTGDWNDGMSHVGRRGRGESVWLAFFSAICANRLAPLCLACGMEKESQKLKIEAVRFISVAKSAFDGDRFIRGYYDGGEPLGSRDCDECKIDVMPQAFAAVAASEIDETLTENAKTALSTAQDILFDREHSIFRLLWPPFDSGDQSPGYIKGYVPGIRENGGQYTHAAVFAALGMLRVGMNREAAELLFTINPLMRQSPYYRIEPYVLAGDVYSNPDCAGRGGWSWYTGAAGWYRTVFIEELCGYRERGDHFSICPRLSDLFPSFTLEIRRGATFYTVRASMSESDFCVLDGKSSENRFYFDGGAHSVEIYSNGAASFPKDREGVDIFMKS